MDCAQEDSTRMRTTHHHYLYFSDGNIILSAIQRRFGFGRAMTRKPEPPEESTLFRVHKSILAKSSEVFSDMLDLPDSPDSTLNPLYDGVPVVVMPDSAEEIEALLNCFYRPWYLHLPNNVPDLIPDIEGLLATASKYQFFDLCKHIIDHIKGQWPNDLQRWDFFAGYVGAGVETSNFLPTDFIPEPAAAIALARKYDIFDILPAALYDLSTIPSLNDWDYRFGDEDHRADPPIDCKGRAARWRLVSQGDLLAVYQGREILAAHAHDFSQDAFFFEACKFGPNQKCTEARALLRRKIYPEGARDILRRLQTLLTNVSDTMCKRCLSTLEYTVEEERKRIWRLLPEIFNLPEACHTYAEDC